MNRILYICDRLKCADKYGGECPGDQCKHTSDVKHAINFETFPKYQQIKPDVIYVEIIKSE